MRIELLDLLRCPACRSDNCFSVEVVYEDNDEIVEGLVACTACRAQFPVHEGYCNLLHQPSAEVLREQKAQRCAEREPSGDMIFPDDPEERKRYILRLPEGHTHSEEHAPMVRYAMEAVDAGPESVVLDLGAGISWTTAQWARRGCKAVSLDIYGNILGCARVMISQGVYFDRVLADMTALPFGDERFDVVFANAAIHHTPDLDMTATEIARVLKPGAVAIFVNEPVAGLLERGRKAAFGRKERIMGFNERIYTAQEWGEALDNARLKPRLEICDEGIDEKLERRKDLPAYKTFPKRQMLGLLRNRTIRRFLLRFFQRIALQVLPFNVVIQSKKASK